MAIRARDAIASEAAARPTQNVEQFPAGSHLRPGARPPGRGARPEETVLQPEASDQNDINQDVWNRREAQNWLRGLQGFTDAGESAAYWRLVDEIRDQPILDLGVGAGRTIPLLRSLTSQYVGVDYLPSMVEISRRKYPFADVRHADARDLSAFADQSFALVNFSFAGIDAVNHEGRRRVIQEARRVLRPDGFFWFSTLNKEGGALRERPWRPRWPDRGAGNVEFIFKSLLVLRRLPRSLANYRRLKRQRVDGQGWAIAPFFAHDFGLLVHYITLQHQLDELRELGFGGDCIVFDPQGRRVDPSGRLQDVEFFNILAR